MVNPDLTFIGKPCKHGHRGIRWINHGSCVDCSREARRRNYVKKIPEHRKPPEHHGLTKVGQHHYLYQTWSEIKRRCYNGKAREYPLYGGRGIGMCQHWRDSFVAFKD